MERKSLTVEMKDESKGLVVARFATLGVKDHDGDVIERGAIGEQAVKVSAYGHASWMGALPVGRGKTFEEGDEARADLRFFMTTAHGREHFETIKEMGDLGEWSFGFDVVESRAPEEEERQLGIRRILSKLKVFEVSPVLRGAGVDTVTLDAKSKDGPPAAPPAEVTPPAPAVPPPPPELSAEAKAAAAVHEVIGSAELLVASLRR